MRIAPLRHSLPNAGDAAVSHKHLSDLPGWSRTDTVEKIQPQGQSCWQQPRTLKGSSPPLQRGPVLRGCRATAIHSTGAVPSAHVSHRQLATCSEGCSCRGRPRLGSSFAWFPLAGFTLCSSADPRQISSWPCRTERRSRPRGFLGSGSPTATPELGERLGLRSPRPAALLLPTGAAGVFGSVSACMGETRASRCDGERTGAGIASLRGGSGDQKTSKDPPNICQRIQAIRMKSLLFCLCPDPGLCEKHFSVECLVANCSSNWFSRV